MDEVARLAEKLEAHFRDVYRCAMRDVPICNDRLEVASVGFREQGGWAFGIVVTPWFMNLFAAPLEGAAPAARRIGLPAGEVEFLSAELDGFSGVLSCSLFSPMDNFGDQQSALDTARAALDLLFAPAEPPAEKPAPKMDRRAFFRGSFAARDASV